MVVIYNLLLLSQTSLMRLILFGTKNDVDVFVIEEHAPENECVFELGTRRDVSTLFDAQEDDV